MKRIRTSYFYTAISTILASATGCAFFDEPLTNLGDLTRGAPPPLTSVPTAETGAPQPANQAANQAANQPPEQRPAGNSIGSSGAYFTVASIADIPEDTQNIAIVHFTLTGANRDTDRDLAMCKALQERMPVTPIDDVPAAAASIIVWPVSESNNGDTCIEMLSNYESIDISNETAARVNDSVAGPFLLTRNSTLGKRMIYDLSYTPNDSLNRGVSEWQLLLASDPADWPDYSSAR